jgi:hypothetical protein
MTTHNHIERRAGLAALYSLNAGEIVFVDMIAKLCSGRHARPIDQSDFLGYDQDKFLPIIQAEIARRNDERN